MRKSKLAGVTLCLCMIIFTFYQTALIKNQENLLDAEKFLLIAHRGASAYAPEHTIASYELSQKMSTDFIEIDLQLTKDGVLVAMHDHTVDRTTDGKGEVSTMTLADIKKLDAGTWFNEAYPEKSKNEYSKLQVPTLQEVFEEFGSQANYYIETKKLDKEFKMERELLRLLNQYNLLDESQPNGKVVIQSFNEESLRLIHEMNSEIPLIKLEDSEEVKKGTADRFEEISEYAVGIGASYNGVDKTYVTKAKKSGLLVHLFTVNKHEEAVEMKSYGANGIFTDDIKVVDGK